MTQTIVPVFVSGVFSMGYLVIAGAFLRSWRRTRELLFAAFALAFAMLAVGQAAVATVGGPTENQPAVYLFRLAAFGMIIAAVIAKNIARRGR